MRNMQYVRLNLPGNMRLNYEDGQRVKDLLEPMLLVVLRDLGYTNSEIEGKREPPYSPSMRESA